MLNVIFLLATNNWHTSMLRYTPWCQGHINVSVWMMTAGRSGVYHLLLRCHLHLVTYFLTYPIKQSPKEANQLSAIQQSTHTLRSQKVPPTAFTSAHHQFISWGRSTQSITPPPPFHFMKAHLNIILTSKSGSYKWSPLPGFPTKTMYTFPLLHTRYMPRPSYSSWFDEPNNIWWEV
jgi:hypothetical protein